MSTAEERLALIEEIYKDALENEPHDLAAAATAVEVTAIQANVVLARQTYYGAISLVLTQDESLVCTAFDAATQAQSAVADARAKEAQIPDLITKVASAVQLAGKLAAAAKKL